MKTGKVDYSFPKTRRLSKKDEYESCFKKGEVFFSRNFVLYALRREDNAYGIRLGMAISKKVGGAVTRNRLKRLLREYFRLSQHQFPMDVDIVVVPKRKIQISKLNLWLVEEDLKPVLRKLWHHLSG